MWTESTLLNCLYTHIRGFECNVLQMWYSFTAKQNKYGVAYIVCNLWQFGVEHGWGLISWKKISTKCKQKETILNFCN